MSAKAPPRILLVDDEAELLKVASRLIEKMGYVVETAPSGGAALDKLARTSYDLVMLDMVMDEMDGVETLRRIRASWPEQHVVILSAYAEPERIDAVRTLGILAYIKKPFERGTLSAVLRNAVQGISTDEAS